VHDFGPDERLRARPHPPASIGYLHAHSQASLPAYTHAEDMHHGRSAYRFFIFRTNGGCEYLDLAICAVERMDIGLGRWSWRGTAHGRARSSRPRSLCGRSWPDRASD